MTTQEPVPEARLFSLEMTHVEERRGVGWSVFALGRHVARRVLGLRRPFRYKVLPGFFTLIAYMPAVAFLGIAAILPDGLEGEILPSPAESYGYITFALILFSALAGPQTLCPDRRDRVLGLYLASPLERTHYLAANAGALITVFFVLTVGPPLLLAIGVALLGEPAASVPVLVYRVVGGGLLLATAYAALGLAAASLTNRRSFAAAITFVVLIGSGIISGVLDQLDAPDWTAAVNFVAMAFEAAARVHGESLELDYMSVPVIYTAYLTWVGLLGGIVWLRYRRMKVVR